ncbi:hypothetical protein CFBP7900_29100 [Xanthomonas hortorum pv. carotae]|uniref:Uncharacterized protein n=1 Tax=Xanthomonas hortorum pv. carotae TaxID=487904 RepID=A0A6V7F0Y4_9XANT|nr:hypothetical protein CFBP7900_29100 [Xanthomonas hortorum pv. carotae]CAD0357131.1 hypothetical protein CFBP7900_29100 [Xanthomonas hortorum pv. carotae]
MNCGDGPNRASIWRAFLLALRVLSTRSADAVPQCRQLGYAAVSLSIRARHERHLHV